MPSNGAKQPLLPVDDALERILKGLAPSQVDECPLAAAVGRTLSRNIQSDLSLPPAPVSSMDGYAVRAEDCTGKKPQLTRVGESAAGHPWQGRLRAGEAVRIFTGAFIPANSDAVVLQEDVDASSENDGARITIHEPPRSGQFIRPAGLDVSAGDTILRKNSMLSARAISLAASAGHATLPVWRQPHIGILSTGDELVLPGETPAPGQIVSSNAIYLATFVQASGGIPIDLGIARDRAGAMLDHVRKAPVPLDMIVTSGGASVGTHDHIVSDLQEAGSALNFWKIAMRPGKPLIHGMIDGVPLLGLPGNPVSTAVCATVFLGPAIARLSGHDYAPHQISAEITCELQPNDRRQDYLRAVLEYDVDGLPLVTPARKQDSSMVSIFANANALIIRPPFDPSIAAGDRVTVMPLAPLL